MMTIDITNHPSSTGTLMYSQLPKYFFDWLTPIVPVVSEHEPQANNTSFADITKSTMLSSRYGSPIEFKNNIHSSACNGMKKPSIVCRATVSSDFKQDWRQISVKPDNTGLYAIRNIKSTAGDVNENICFEEMLFSR